jgi:hypothetical protein
MIGSQNTKTERFLWCERFRPHTRRLGFPSCLPTMPHQTVEFFG